MSVAPKVVPLTEIGARNAAQISPAFAVLLDRENLSQNALAQKLKISSGYMSQLMSGKRFAGAKIRRRIQDAFPRFGFDDLFHEVPRGVR